MALTEAESEVFLIQPKALHDKVKWKQRSEAPFLYRADARVLLTESGDVRPLDLVLPYNDKAKTFTFILRYGKSENIRRLDFNKPHRNPGANSRTKIDKLHKHKWTDAYQDQWAYEPGDIEDPSDVQKSLGNFLHECHIDYESKQLGNLTVQGRWV
ncbi:hypothetical protein CO251_05920 [Sulfobacillus sp. hq2]|uniref:DUF6978 family protein n=1 Tax=Sulfobacillus thermotolerans TaxID=338644 RepID=UPI000CD2EEBD|nr:hypothetical protein CO251_05920 [Sulfobacillus sp. hq2]